MVGLHPNTIAAQQGFTQGLEAFNTGLRMQQLRSLEAYRKLQEQQLAQQLASQMEAHDLAVQERAEMAKAAARYQVLTADTIPMAVEGPPEAGGPPTLGEVPVANPNRMLPEDAYMQTFGTVINRFRPEKGLDVMADYARAKQYRRDAEQQAFVPHTGVAKTSSGRDIEYFQGSPRSAIPIGSGNVEIVKEGGEQFYLDPKGKPTRIPRDMTDLRTAMAENALAQKAPDLSEPNPTNPRLRYIPDQNWDAFAKRQGISPGTKADLEAVEIGSSNLIETGRKLLPLINDRTVGVKGELSRLVQRTGLQMIIPSLQNPEVAEADAAGRAFTSSVIRSLRSDSNINKDEVAALHKAANAIEWTVPVEAKRRVAVFLEKAATLARDSYKRLGRPSPPQYYTFDEIYNRIDDGTPTSLTPEEGAALYKKTVDSLIHDIRQEVGQ